VRAGGASSRAAPSDADTLYAAWRGWHPRAAPTPTPDGRKALKRILDECGGLERAGVYLAWVREAEDLHAQRLRGDEAWPGGDVTPRHDLVSLSRNIEPRMAAAEAWDARGRRPPQGPGPPGRGPPTSRGPPRARPTPLDVHAATLALLDQESP
jgi:hypothetical protein